MTKQSKGTNFWTWLLLGVLVVGLVGANEARAAIGTGGATCTAQSKTAGTSLACTVATENFDVNNVAVLWFAGDNTATVDGNDGLLTSVSDSGGNVWTVQRCFTNAQGGAANGATTCIATARITTALVSGSGTITANFSSITAKAIVVREFTVAAGNALSVTGTPQDLANDGADPGSMTISGLTSGEYLFVRSTALERAAGGAWTATSGYTSSSCNGTTGGGAAGNMEICGEYRVLTGTGDTGNPTGTGVDNASLFIAFKEAANTTLGNGTDPSNASLAPGAAATMADAFTFQTSSGTDTITDVTVGLGTGASAGLSLVEITDDAGTTVYGSVADPASDTPTVTLSTNTLTATITQTQYKIRVTPKSHASMPAPAGATYTVTAKINSWTGTNTKVGSDTAGTTVTIDNLSPANVTGASGTAGDTQVALTWTNPADADLNSIVVLRDTVAVADTPAEGTTYSVGNTIGTSVVRCVVTPPTASCTDTGLTNGTSYHYKIFTKDTNDNYSATGVVPTGSPFIPSGPGCYSKATGNWNQSATWAADGNGNGTCPGAGGVPDSTTPVYINFSATSHTVTVNVTTAAAASVNIGAPGSGTAGLAISSGTLDVGGSVTITGGTGTKKALLSFTTGTLKVGGTITSSGATDITFGTGTVEYDGSGTQTVANYGYYNLTINKSSGTASPGANITIGNNLTVNAGTLDLVTYTADGSASGTVSVANGATLRIGGGGDFPANYATPPSLGATSTVEYYGNIYQPVTNVSYGHLALSGTGRKAPGAGTITIAGNFSIASGTECDADVSDPTLKIAGNFTNNGTYTAGLSTVELNGASVQSISGVATTFYHLTISNTAGVNAGSTSIGLTGTFSNNGTFNADTSTVTFNGTAAQAIGGTTAPTFYNLTLNNSTGLTLNVDTTVGNLLTLTTGKITTGTSTAPNPYSYTLTTSAPCTTPSVSRPGGGPGHVVGNLRKKIPTGSSVACTFEVGDSAKYTPIDVTFASVGGEGSVTGATMPWSPDGHPVISSIDIDPNLNVNRFWTLKSNTVSFTSYEATFNFCSSTVTTDCPSTDIDTGASTADFVIRRYSPEYPNSGTWSNVTLATSGAQPTSTKGTGITGVGDFAVGQSTIQAFSREREWIYQRELYY